MLLLFGKRFGTSPERFCDVIGAFDAVVRQILFPVHISDDVIAYMCKTLNFDTDIIHQLVHHITTCSFLNEHGMSDYWVNMVGECHEGTWFSTQGLDDVVVSRIGSIPGDPLGDIVYNFLASKVHGEILQECVDANILTVLPPLPELHPLAHVRPNVSVTLFDNLYVDDACFFILGGTPHGHIDKLVRLVKIVRKVYSSHLLMLNMKCNKTEVKVSIRGPGSRQYRGPGRGVGDGAYGSWE